MIIATRRNIARFAHINRFVRAIRTIRICSHITACAAIILAAHAISAQAQEGPFTDEQIKKGAAIYSQNCSPCHGPRMLDPQGAFDLKLFPRDQKERFMTSVGKGKNQMPPWSGLLSTEDIDTLWAYVLAGEKLQ